MSDIKEVLREMRSAPKSIWRDPSKWADAIEAAMRKPVGEVGYSWTRSTTSQSATHAYPLTLLSDQHIPPGTKLYALPPDAAGEIELLQDTLRGIELYAVDTLSKPVSGPDDRKWYRDGVIEIVKRARIALAGKEVSHE